METLFRMRRKVVILLLVVCLVSLLMGVVWRQGNIPRRPLGSEAMVALCNTWNQGDLLVPPYKTNTEDDNERMKKLQSTSHPDTETLGTRTSDRRNTVPKIIHQIWNNETVPSEFVNNIKGLVALNPYPEWSYYFWPLGVGRKFIERKYPAILKLYDAVPNLMKADILRLLVVHQFGGVYFDLDTVGVKPLTPFVDNTSCSMVNVPPENYISRNMVVHVEFLTNNVLLCRPNHPFFSAVIRQLEKQPITCRRAIQCAGPHFISSVFHELKKAKETFDIVPSVASYELFNDRMPDGLKPAPYKVCTGREYNETEFWRRKLCDEWRRRGESNRKLSKLAYSYHTWFNVVSRKVTMDTKNDIRHIVPNVVIYK